MIQSGTGILNLSRVAIEKPWGGDRLNRLFPSLGVTDGKIGEVWLVSTVGDEHCHSQIVKDGQHGKTLRDCLLENPHKFLGKNLAEKYPPGEFPLLFKWIDASTDLSVQVHPDDELAIQLDLGKNGKEETWLILDAEPEATVRVGFTEGWDMARLIKAVSEGEDISYSLQRFSVEKGDLIHIPPGTVHSIGGGILLAEIQQPSDVTFRIHDGKTLGSDDQPRELHLDLAAKSVSSTAADFCIGKEFSSGVWEERVSPFAYQVLELKGEWHGEVPLPEEGCCVLTCLSGEAFIEGGSAQTQEILLPGDVRLILPGTTSLSLKTAGEGWFAVFSPRSGLVDP